MPATKSLQELIIAAHFQAPISFSVMDLADWATHFENDFPIVQQLAAAGPLDLAVPGTPQMPFAIRAMEVPPLPRMFLRSADSRYSMQLQDDRFAFGWHRTEPIGDPADYPGFEEFETQWREALDAFEIWTESRFRQRPTHRLIELSYNNAVPLEQGGEKKRLSEIFKFVQAAGRQLIGFNTNWVEVVRGGDGEKAIGTVTAAVALGTAPPSLPVLSFTFSGVGSVAAGEQSGHILNILHTRIREIYEASIVADDN